MSEIWRSEPPNSWFPFQFCQHSVFRRSNKDTQSEYFDGTSPGKFAYCLLVVPQQEQVDFIARASIDQIRHPAFV